MVTGWVEIFGIGMPTGVRAESAFVEACTGSRDHRGHEMLTCDSSKEEGESGLTPVSPMSGRHTPHYFRRAAV